MSNDERYSGEPLLLYPIGVVRSEFHYVPRANEDSGLGAKKDASGSSVTRRKTKDLVSELVLHPEHEALLDGIEGFSHIHVLFWPHQLDPESRSLQKVHPRRRKDIPEQGIFATRSPTRPNPILLSTVRLLAREGARLRVQGLDAADGSPLLDIKPYSRELSEAEKATMPAWMELLIKEFEEENANCSD